VAAHEAGHALQQQAAYALFDLRMWLVPATQIASFAWSGLFMLGFVFRGFGPQFIGLAIAVFSVLTLFQVVTLPVEFDASRRAKEQLLKLGLVQRVESPGVSAVLNAAAMTYVASMLTAVLELVGLLLMARDQRR